MATGASVEIRILSPQRITDRNAALSYWVGLDLPNDAFIQAGYGIWGTSQARWFWEYFLPGTANELKGFLGTIGNEIGPNGTWHRFSVESIGTTWFAYMDNQQLGSVELGVSSSGGNAPYALAEVAGTVRSDDVLGPVEFRNLSYRDPNGIWGPAPVGEAIIGYGVGSDRLSSSYPNYSVVSIPSSNSHWLVGSNLPRAHNRDSLWPWYFVSVKSPIGSTTGTGWYIYSSIVNATATQSQQIDATHRKEFKEWLVNGQKADSHAFYVFSNKTFEATYVNQFYVNVTSSLGNAVGYGWYDEGSEAGIAVNPNKIPTSGFLGILGFGSAFDHWQGDYSGTTNPAFITVVRPLNIEAVWGIDYGVLPWFVAGLLAVTFVYLVLTERRKERSARESSPRLD